MRRLVEKCFDEWRYFEEGRLHETSDKGSERINVYWRNVDQPTWTGKDTDKFWSAAFISFCMAQAGDNGRFKKSTGHCVYINDAIAKKDDPNAFFQGKRIDEYAPKVGDLVCGWRVNPMTFDEAPSNGWYSSHTDIIVAVRPDAIDVMGGNVSQSVTKRTVGLLPDGRINPDDRVAKYLQLFAIMKNNL